MPLARFEKVAPEKREHLLDVAAHEFAIHGFTDASLNRILEQAQMSKGATYYSFEEKVDLCFLLEKETPKDQRGIIWAHFESGL